MEALLALRNRIFSIYIVASMSSNTSNGIYLYSNELKSHLLFYLAMALLNPEITI